MAVAIEDAGFDIRDQTHVDLWLWVSQSLNIGKAIDKAEGNEREILRKNQNMWQRAIKNLKGKVRSISGEKGRYTRGNSEWGRLGNGIEASPLSL